MGKGGGQRESGEEDDGGDAGLTRVMKSRCADGRVWKKGHAHTKKEIDRGGRGNVGE